jgi:hypothetical protein
MPPSGNKKKDNMKPKAIITKAGKVVIREYKGHIIESYNLAQLLCSETRGMSYNVWKNIESYDRGEESMNARETCLDCLCDAKAFIDDLKSLPLS